MTTTKQQPGLTGREFQILVLLSNGLTNSQIGHKLGLSEDTIKTHVKRIGAELGPHDGSSIRPSMVRKGFEYGFLINHQESPPLLLFHGDGRASVEHTPTCFRLHRCICQGTRR